MEEYELCPLVAAALVVYFRGFRSKIESTKAIEVSDGVGGIHPTTDSLIICMRSFN